VCERDRKADLQARLHGIMQEAVPTLHTCANESRWTTHTRAVFPMHRSIPVTRISSNRDVFTAEIPARALPAGALGNTGMRRVAALAAKYANHMAHVRATELISKAPRVHSIANVYFFAAFSFPPLSHMCASSH